MKYDNRLKKLVADYLKDSKLMQIATSSNNRPWVASIWYVHDMEWNLYFISRKTRRHSIELKKNPNVAGAIVKPHVIGSGEKVRGLQFEGTCEECFGDTLKKARRLFLSKYPTAEKIPLKKLQSPDYNGAFYAVRPKSFVLFDEINFPDEPRQEIKL